MISLDANIRNTKTKGELSALRNNGSVPAVIYGGEAQNETVSISKKLLKSLIDKENFLSNIVTLNVDGKPQNVLPREIKYHIISDEPIHVDFLRVVPGVKIRIEVPVQFINHEKSPGLKRGGVLNIVRRKVELRCPSEKILLVHMRSPSPNDMATMRPDAPAAYTRDPAITGLAPKSTTAPSARPARAPFREEFQ